MLVTKYIFQSGVGAAINGGFSHRRSVLADMNAHRNPLRNMYQPLLRHEVVLYNCFTVSYDRLIKPAVPSAVSYRSIGCMVQPLSGEASGKQYQLLARAAINGVGNREETGLL